MTTESRNLEVISKSVSIAERRRVPRLNLTTEQFRHSRNGKIFSVVDLSTEGLALRILARDDFFLFPVGTPVEGTLNLSGDKLHVKASVRHLGPDMVGCQFEDLDSVTTGALKFYLDPERLGKELQPFPAAEGGALWYHGAFGTDLLIWRSPEKKISKLSLFILGSFVQWEAGSALSTGRVDSSFERSDVRGAFRFETLLLKEDREPDTGKLGVAKTLILSSNLPQALKEECANLLPGPGLTPEKAD